MAIRLEDKYGVRAVPASAAYPGGSFKNETAPLAADGTPLDNAFANDFLGFFQKLLDEAAIIPSGVPDTVLSSDYFDALSILFPVTQIVEIGPWDMDTTNNISVAHGFTLANIREVQVLIINDSQDNIRDLTTAAGPIAGAWNIDTLNINLARTAGGFFDSVNYNDGLINRGWISFKVTA